jgi:hypothetical protein
MIDTALRANATKGKATGWGKTGRCVALKTGWGVGMHPNWVHPIV